MNELSYVYIISNKNRTVLYIGVTNDIERRMFEHKSGHGCEFSNKYNLTELMYYEEYPLMIDAIAREKQLKKWHRAWKWKLIKRENEGLNDISKDWFSKEDYENIEICSKMDKLDEYYREN